MSKVALEQFRLGIRRDPSGMRPTERESMLTRDNGSEIRALAMFSFPVVAALAWPSVADGAAGVFITGVTAVLVLNLLGWVVAWHRYPRWIESLLPLLSTAGVWLMAASTGGFSSGYGMLLVIPMLWIAMYADPADIAIGLAMCTILVIPPMHDWFSVLPDQGSIWQRASLILLLATAMFGVRPLVNAMREQVHTSRRATYSLRASQAALAHDLRTPLTSMCALAELAEQRLDDEQVDIEVVREYVRRISALGWRSEGIIRGVLELSRAAELLPDVEEIDVRRVVRDVARTIDGVNVEIRDVPAVIVGHEHSIRRLFGNLFENAALHGVGPSPGDIARVEVAGGDHLGGWRFTVRDHGPGIAPGESGLVFQPWRRGAAARDGGHGLGLAIVQAIVEQHGGAVEVTDTSPSGACFAFTLARAPRVAGNEDERDAVARVTPGVPVG